jgi:alcohol dehydrogenase
VRAMAVRSFDEPLAPMDLPEPELRPGHALLEVLTCGVCFSDVKTSRGRMGWSDRLALPHVPGHEVCARVIASDPPDAMAAGTVVVVYHLAPCRRCARCRAGEDNLCVRPLSWTGFMSPGGFEERVVVPLDRLTPVPDSIDPVSAAPFTCALGTAYRAVVTRGQVQGGSRVAVVGLGGVGIHALQVAHAVGGRVVGLDPSPRAVEAARALGLDAHAPDEAAEAAILELTGGEGVDVVIDTVGLESTAAQSFRLVRPGGRIVGVGYTQTSSFVLPTPRFVLEEVELVGSRYVRLDELSRAIRLVEDGKVRMVIDRTLALADANAALEALERGEVVGRIVLDVAGARR